MMLNERMVLLVAVLAPMAALSQGAEPPGPIGVITIPKLWQDPYAPRPGWEPEPVLISDRPPIEDDEAPEAATRLHLLERHYGLHWANLDNEGSAAAFSYGIDDGWHQLRIGDGTDVWLAPEDAGEFTPMLELLERSLTFATGRWDGRIHELPGDPGRTIAGVGPRQALDIVSEVTAEDGSRWYRVTILEDSGCETYPPRVLAAGYIPAVVDGETTVWFYTGGC
jgi:hypothetical protein